MFLKNKKALLLLLIIVGIIYIFLTSPKKIIEGASDCGKGCDSYCKNHEYLVKAAKTTCERARSKVKDVDNDEETLRNIHNKIDKIKQKIDKMTGDSPCG